MQTLGILLRIIGPILLSIVAVAPYLLPKNWVDQGTKKYALVRRVHVVVLLLIASVTVWISLSEYSASHEDSKTISLQSRKIDSMNTKLDSLASQLEPFQELANTLFPNQLSLDALFLLADSIRSDISKAEKTVLKGTREIVEQRMHREFPDSLTSEVKRKLLALKESPNWQLNRIQVYCQEGNRERLRFSNELIALFRESGFDTEITTGMILGRSTTSPMVCRFNPSNSASALRVLRALWGIIDCSIDTLPNLQLNSATIEIKIFGDPYYLQNGKVELR